MIDRKRYILYLWIGLAWILMNLLHDAINSTENFVPRIFNNIWRTIYVIVLNFIFFEFVLPFIRKKRKTIFYNILLAIPIFFLGIILYAYGAWVWRLTGIGLHLYTSLATFDTVGKGVTNSFGYSVGSIFFFGVIIHIHDYIKLTRAAQQLFIEKQQAELNYLKSQTNPHFLFNTLNNIYSLSKDKSDLAPESILRLSKILRYMLYEAGGEFVSIEQELKIMGDYISLEKLRYDESLHVNFNYDVEEMKQSLPPLLLIPLVENAFKHGVSETRINPFVEIHLSVRNRNLLLNVKNSSESIPGQTPIKENIGLSNLRRQLELLYKDYDLSLIQGNSTFTAILKINLASHV